MGAFLTANTKWCCPTAWQLSILFQTREAWVGQMHQQRCDCGRIRCWITRRKFAWATCSNEQWTYLNFPMVLWVLSFSRKGQCWSVNICFRTGLSFWPARLSTMIVRQVSGTADNEASIAACPDVLLHSVKQHRLGCQCDFAKMPLVLLIEYYSWLMQQATLEKWSIITGCFGFLWLDGSWKSLDPFLYSAVSHNLTGMQQQLAYRRSSTPCFRAYGVLQPAVSSSRKT